MALRMRLQKTVRSFTIDANPSQINVFDTGVDKLIEGAGFLSGVFVAEVMARGATSGSVNCYRLAVHFKRTIGGVLSLVGTVGSGLTCEEDAAWDATLIADTDPDIMVEVTGDAAETVEWTVFASLFSDSEEI
jgi:hypothetical protein